MNPTPGLVTCIIPVYNRAEMLRASVGTVLEQTYRHFEIVIVDDGSTDDTGRVADELAASHSDRIRVCHVANGGPGRAREAGRQEARGEFIQYLDSDDFLLPSKFQCQVAALQSHPHCDVAYGKTRLVDSDRNVLVAPYKWSGERREQLFPGLLVDRWWNTHTPLYRASLCERIGAWSDMRMGEDWEYDARIGALSTQIVFCDEYVSEHRQHTASRLTGGELSPSALQDFARLLPRLYECALQAGVPQSAPEMQYFSRWAFSTARQLGRYGYASLAAESFELARSAGHPSKPLDLRLYGQLAGLIGWNAAGVVAENAYRLLRRAPRNTTFKQSWMPQ